MSHESLEVLEEFGGAFRGQWSLLEAAVIHARRHGVSPDPAFRPNGLRPSFRTEVNLLREPSLRWAELEVPDSRLPGAIGGLLQAHLRGFRDRSRRAHRFRCSEPSVELTVTIPSAALLELKVSAFEQGVDIYSELAHRLEVAARKAPSSLTHLSGAVNEIPVRISREAFDRAQGVARTIGSRATAVATHQMLLDLPHEVTV